MFVYYKIYHFFKGLRTFDAQFFKSQRLIYIITLSMCIWFGACDSIELEDPDYLISGTSVFKEAETADAAVAGMYSSMMSTIGFASGATQSVGFLCGLSADEFELYTQQSTYGEFYNLALTADNSFVKSGLWDNIYASIYKSNAILEGLRDNPDINIEEREPLEGEAYFVRAFCYFYLTNLFGDVPMVTTTDYPTNQLLERSKASDIYTLMVEDLKKAVEFLPETYERYNNERIRPNRYAAMGLLARVYLYGGQWAEAEAMAGEVISQADLYSLPSVEDVFLKNSRETLWQLMPVVGGKNTNEGNLLILTSKPSFVAMNKELEAAFEATDLRREHWIGHYTDDSGVYTFSYKYKVKNAEVLSEYSMVLRLAEQYLIRAEARIQQGKLALGLEDLNQVRSRAAASLLPLTDKESLMEAVYRERRLELFNEWGHRWLDLKRSGGSKEVLEGYDKVWEPMDALYPIPLQEITTNPNLTQNDGYSS